MTREAILAAASSAIGARSAARWWFAVMVGSAALSAEGCSSPLSGGGGTGGAGPVDAAAAGYGTGGVAGAGSDGAAGGGGIGMPGQLCGGDADCGNAFLACVSVQGGQPGQSQCLTRYEQTCQVDSDCGPTGFTCMPYCPDAGSAGCSSCPGQTSCGYCVQSVPNSPCNGDDQCPTGWVCEDICGSGIAGNTRCYPPFFDILCVN